MGLARELGEVDAMIAGIGLAVVVGVLDDGVGDTLGEGVALEGAEILGAGEALGGELHGSSHISAQSRP